MIAKISKIFETNVFLMIFLLCFKLALIKFIRCKVFKNMVFSLSVSLNSKLIGSAFSFSWITLLVLRSKQERGCREFILVLVNCYSNRFTISICDLVYIQIVLVWSTCKGCFFNV